MKKTVAIVLAIVLLFSSGCLTFFATNGRLSSDKAYEIQSEKITFDADYVEIGKEITASVDYDGEVLYEWYVDGVKISEDGNTFTPTKYDVEKIVTLKAFTESKKYIGSRSICISRLPVVYVETVNRKAVVDKTEQDAYIKIQGNSQFKDSSQLYDGDTVIKGRGNTTLLDAKKPFKLKLGSKADVFGMGKNKHWVLLSNPYDVTNMKNWVAYSASETMGLDCQQSEPVTLIMNGVYAGTYYLCEHIRIGENRVEITDWDDEAESAAKAIYKKNSDVLTKDDRDIMIDEMTANMDWVTDDVVEYNGMTFTVSNYYDVPDVNGGYLMVIDKNQRYNSTNGVSIGIEKPEGIGDGMYDYITGYYQAFEDALFSDDFCTEYDGKTMRYTDFIDVDSFAKGIIINEFGCNADFGFRSTYMYKDIDGLLKYGPVWDLDLAFGKSGINGKIDDGLTEGWKSLSRKIIQRLCSDPYFLNRLRNLYWEYRYTAIADIFKEGGLIDSEYERIKEASYANEETWSYDNDFEDAVKILKRWSLLRAEWLDKQFKSIETIYNSMKKNFTTCYPVDDYVLTTDYVEKLEIINTPTKLDYNHGDEIDISGLELKAYFADGTESIVEPTGVLSYAKTYIGERKVYVDYISDEDSDDIYVSLKYKNASVDYKINVSPKDDYERVEELIKKCPNESGFNQRYLKQIFEAQAAYEALSDEAKAEVANYSRLEAAMECVDRMAEASDSGVVGCYIAGYNMRNSKKDMVFILKDTPASLRWTLPNDKGTITFTPSKDMRATDTVGGYTVWTVWATTQNFSARALYRNTQCSGSFEYVSSDYNSTEYDFKKITYTPSVNLGTDAIVNLESGPLTQKVIIKENGYSISESDSAEDSVFTLNVPFEVCGEHSLEIYFVSGGNEMYYDSIDILVRDEPENTESMLTGAVRNVICESLGNYEKNYTITVKGRAVKICFMDDEGNEFSIDRNDYLDNITSYDIDGEECLELSRMLDHEIWNLNLRIKPAHYTVFAFTEEDGWEEPERGFRISVLSSKADGGVFSISADTDITKIGTKLPVTVITDKTVSKLQILVDDAAQGEVTFSTSYAVDKGDTFEYSVYVILRSRGEHTLRVYAKINNVWQPCNEHSPTFAITAK